MLLPCASLRPAPPWNSRRHQGSSGTFAWKLRDEGLAATPDLARNAMFHAVFHDFSMTFTYFYILFTMSPSLFIAFPYVA